MAFEGGCRGVLLPATACGTNKVSGTRLDRIFLVQGDWRESDGFQKKKHSVDFQLEVDVFLKN